MSKAETGGDLNGQLAGLVFFAGSVFPDMDVLLMAAGKRFYLKRHQGPTHSLPMALLYAALLASIPALQIGWSWELKNHRGVRSST